ncbi:MAG: glycine cleavage system protein GcvH [Bacillota bacterium]
MKTPKELYYAETHEWVKVEGDYATIGISDFAQDSLGEIVFVELPEVDDQLSKDDEFATVESVKAASDIIAPVSGVVVEVNEDLEDSPELLNEDPYENWIVKIEIEDKSELDGLMDAAAYEKMAKEEE